MFDFPLMETANAAKQKCRQPVELWAMGCATQAKSVNARRQMMKEASLLTFSEAIDFYFGKR